MDEPPRYPVPPFTAESAAEKVQKAEDAWNGKDPHKIAMAYSPDSEWRNRSEFIKGRQEIEAFLERKWTRELDYKLKKYLWTFNSNRIAVCFEYEFHDASGQWFRAYGNENWEFDDKGYMRKRIASINESPIELHERRIAVAAPVLNRWLIDQGTGLDSFPLAGGNLPTYTQH